MPHFQIIDTKGTFTPYRGVSVLASIKADTQNDFWTALYTALQKSPLISKYYSLCDYKTYHMTTLLGFTEDEYYPNWHPFVSEQLPFFKELTTKLDTLAFEPVITISGGGIDDTLRLIVQLPKEQQRLLESLEKEVGLDKTIPSPMNISLAYAINKNEIKTFSRAIQNEIDTIIRPLKNNQILLNTPKLCFFNDKSNFTLWDGNINPFNFAPPRIFFDKPLIPQPEQTSYETGCCVLS
ncbi:MAG: hypothetical protein H0U75_06920 [Legionella sp.]|nr:hypothetical protein [Legionella sp.]